MAKGHRQNKGTAPHYDRLLGGESTKYVALKRQESRVRIHTRVHTPQPHYIRLSLANVNIHAVAHGICIPCHRTIDAAYLTSSYVLYCIAKICTPSMRYTSDIPHKLSIKQQRLCEEHMKTKEGTYHGLEAGETYHVYHLSATATG